MASAKIIATQKIKFGGIIMDYRNLSENEVTERSLQSVLAKNFSENEIDDGDLVISYDGIVAVVRVEHDRNLIQFISKWPTDGSFSKVAASVANHWNSTKKFGRASYHSDENAFYFDYCLAYNDGVNFKNFNESLGWFFATAKGFDKILAGEED